MSRSLTGGREYSRFFSSIRNKVIIFSCSISLIPLVLVLVACYQIAKKTFTKNTLNELTAIAESNRTHFNCFMAARRDRVLDFSSDGFTRTHLEQMHREDVKKGRTVASLNRQIRVNKKPLDTNITAVIVLNLDGKVIAASDEASLLYNSNNGCETQIQVV